jgi:hypothetical protein
MEHPDLVEEVPLATVLVGARRQYADPQAASDRLIVLRMGLLSPLV